MQRNFAKHALFGSFVIKTIKKTLNWIGRQCPEAFEKIKAMLTLDLLLTHYDPKNDMNLASDACSYGIRTCIMHKRKNGSIKPIVHGFRTLFLALQNYSVSENEFRDCLLLKISLIPPWKKIYFTNGSQIIASYCGVQKCPTDSFSCSDWELFY